MPSLNWEAFAKLPGSLESNFEMLCRVLIRRHYAQYGEFAALAVQPGVEFHLKLERKCSLGNPGRWYGWQCRWYDLPGGRALGATRKKKIVKAIKTTERVLPDLTDWVLWTRRPLTKGDQKWFEGLKTHMDLHMWSASEVEEHLSGDAEIFRSTYFGELVLTPEILFHLHEKHVAPIRQRWIPEVHQTIDAERELRRMLIETDAWEDVREFAQQLSDEAATIDADASDLIGPVADAVGEVSALVRIVAASLADGYSAVIRGDLDLLQQQIKARPALQLQSLAVVPRKLRASRHRASLSVTNAIADIRRAQSLFDQIEIYPMTRLVSVLADAGNGKTELAAQLTAAFGNRPAGILLHGKDLHAGNGLDDLAHGVVIQGIMVATMEALVAAVDAAGQRSRRRLPIVIDGLNEAEDPRDWKNAFASLSVSLLQYPYALVVSTVRGEFADEALPSEVGRLHIPDFDRDTREAVQKYFAYYRIDAADAELPWGLLRHPLTLRLFCEVTNPKREKVVGIEAMPGSLTALFDSYLARISKRVAELAPRTRRYYEHEVRESLVEIGLALWGEVGRSLDIKALRHRLGDDTRPWNESIIRALEQEGVLLRVTSDVSTNNHVGIVFDALAGHLIASAILIRQGRAEFEAWLKDSETIKRLEGPLNGQHPLASDTFRALVGILPRRHHGQQLWPLLQEPMRTTALQGAAYLESAYLDRATIAELSNLAAQPPTGERDLFKRLWQTRGAPAHPLNAQFVDDVLRTMSVAQRDLRWTERIRYNKENILEDLIRLENRWRSEAERSHGDQLRAQWVMWTLTSTVSKLRDQATRTLYWFGRGDPAVLFNLTLRALTVNDPYVSERMLAASYGIVMAHQLPEQVFIGPLREFLVGLRDALCGAMAFTPTLHWLHRLYVHGTVELACKYHQAAVPQGLQVNGQVPFAPGPAPEPMAETDSRAFEVRHALSSLTFADDSLGRLLEGRNSYKLNFTSQTAVTERVRATLYFLGWRENSFGSIEKSIDSHRYRSDRSPTDAYYRKYGWIGFYLHFGILDDKQLLPANERLSEVQVDPSFPEPPQPAPVYVPSWISPTPAEDRSWLQRGRIDIPDKLLYPSDLGGDGGPWVAVSGRLRCEGDDGSRQVWGWLTALLVTRRDADRLFNELATKEYPGNFWIPEEPDDYYTFAGEIPWSLQFARRDTASDPIDLYRRALRVKGSPIVVEILTHEYAWESYHSELNRAGGALVPSQPFSQKFDLRGIPQEFNQALPTGALAAKSFSAPVGFKGHLLYLREDLVRRYAATRRLVWFVWGERQLHHKLYQSPPEWLSKDLQSHKHVWRVIRSGEQLSKGLAPLRKTKSKRR